MFCSTCSNMNDASVKYCGGCGNPLAVGSFRERQGNLVRPQYGRMIAGVCAAFASQYGFDVALVRLALVLMVLLGAGTAVLAYIAAWIIMPRATFAVPQMPMGATAS